jgi:hypothetical protein
MQISSTTSTAASSAATNNSRASREAAAEFNGGPKKDKAVKPAAMPAPEQNLGGLTMAAVWASQAEERGRVKAEADAAKAAARAQPLPAFSPTDGTNAASRFLDDSLQATAARQAEAAKAAEERRAEAKTEDPFAPAEKSDPFAPPPEKTDPFAASPETLAARTAPGGAMYGAASTATGYGRESGSLLDVRF